MPWWSYALLSAGFAAGTAVLAKVGIEGVPSNLATAIRTVVIVLFAWGLVLCTGEYQVIGRIGRRSFAFLVLSGLATGCSWLAYYRALQLQAASRVAPIDKLSLPLTLALAVLCLGEPLTLRLGAGVALMTVGALLTLS